MDSVARHQDILNSCVDVSSIEKVRHLQDLEEIFHSYCSRNDYNLMEKLKL